MKHKVIAVTSLMSLVSDIQATLGSWHKIPTQYILRQCQTEIRGPTTVLSFVHRVQSSSCNYFLTLEFIIKVWNKCQEVNKWGHSLLDHSHTHASTILSCRPPIWERMKHELTTDACARNLDVTDASTRSQKKIYPSSDPPVTWASEFVRQQSVL